MKKSTVRLLASLTLLVATAGARAAGTGDENVQLPEDVLPQLKPLLEQAMQQSPRTLERNLDLIFAKADGYIARASSLPSVGGYLTAQLQEEKRGDVSGYRSGSKLYYNFSVNQAVWQWGALEAARGMSRIDRDLAQMNYGEAYRALASEIRAAYLGLIIQKMAFRNTADSARLAEENLKRQQARYNANQVTYGEIMQHQLRLDEASLAARRARADLDFSISNFRSLTGNAQFAEADVPEAIADVTQAPVVSQAAASSATDLSVAVQMAEKEVEKAKLARVGPRYALFPKLGVVAGVSRDENTRSLKDSQGLPRTDKYQSDSFYAGAQINWMVFDGFSSKGQKLAALTRLRRAEQRLTTLREATARNLDRDRANVVFTWDSYQLAQMRLRMAREGLAHLRDEATRGQVSQEQVDAAQTGVFYNQIQAQSALAGHLSAVVQYLSAKGMDPVAQSAVQR